jgi:hypothetical protein
MHVDIRKFGWDSSVQHSVDTVCVIQMGTDLSNKSCNKFFSTTVLVPLVQIESVITIDESSRKGKTSGSSSCLNSSVL